MENKNTAEHNYTGYGWEGKNYRATRDLGIADIAKLIRKDLKKEYPACTFSVTIERYSGGQSMTVALMAAPFEVFDKTRTTDKNGNVYVPRDFEYAQLNHYTASSTHADAEGYNNGAYITPEAWEVLAFANKLASSYNFDDSDAQSDYFHVNFYLHLAVGRWDKPFKKSV